MRLETIQTDAAFQTLVTSGALTGDPVFAEVDFAEAYAWLSGEMSRRLSSSGSGMVWAWARIRRRDLATELRRARGEVLLTLEVPAERILLHGFDDWHAVLNRSLLVPLRSREAPDEWWGRAEPIMDEFDRRLGLAQCSRLSMADWPIELRLEVEASWAGIFDPISWGVRGSVQATLHKVVAQDVVSAVRIK